MWPRRSVSGVWIGIRGRVDDLTREFEFGVQVQDFESYLSSELAPENLPFLYIEVMNKLNLLKAILAAAGFKIALELFGLLVLINSYFEEDLTVFMWAFSATQLMIMLLMLLTVLIFMFAVGGFRDLRIGDQTVPIALVIVISLLSGIAFVYLQVPLNYLFTFLPGGPESMEMHPGVKSTVIPMWVYPMLIGRVLMVPVFEELFFRGFILKRMIAAHNWKIALLVSALLFGLLHLPDVTQSLTALFGGLIAGGLYLGTGRILAPILFHFAWNLGVYAMNAGLMPGI